MDRPAADGPHICERLYSLKDDQKAKREELQAKFDKQTQETLEASRSEASRRKREKAAASPTKPQASADTWERLFSTQTKGKASVAGAHPSSSLLPQGLASSWPLVGRSLSSECQYGWQS